MKKISLFLLIILAIATGYIYLFPSEENTQYNQEQDEVLVYETEAENADDCSSYEQYDAESSVCFYECEDEATCENIAKEIDAEIATWYDNEWEEENIEEDVIASNSNTLRAEYRVARWEKIKLKSGEQSQDDADLWTLVSKISPNWLSDTYVDTFQIFDDKNDDTIAFVDDEDNNGTWRIAINVAAFSDSTEKEKYRTIVHELGHIITLNTTQFQDQNPCKTLQVEEWCFIPTAYVAGFAKQFWTDAERAESESDANTLYEKNTSHYVSEYASTNFVEDIAESFSYFVFSGKTEPDSVAAQKIAYLGNLPALVKIKNEMLGGVKYNMVRARKT